MKERWLSRSFVATLQNNIQIEVHTKRFISLDIDELGAINYSVKPLNADASITYKPYIDSGVTNKDTNWDDKFWDTLNVSHENNQAFIQAKTMKTDIYTCTLMESQVFIDGKLVISEPNINADANRASLSYNYSVKQNETYAIHKFGGYTVDRNYDKSQLVNVAKSVLKKALKSGFLALLENQKQAWSEIWEMADITIEGDVKAQQAIRFNIFQLNQTYLGNDPLLNIGPKGFTGEKYGGSTYWDTEAYCLPFYMATKSPNVAKSLLEYRFHHLEKAIENAKKLGFNTGAALYPMVTMNGEECHNEWEITFEEIHRNGAIAFAIYNYQRYTGDVSYTHSKGIFVLIAITRFWYQRFNFSEQKQKFVMLGVTGPNEYENNVNNNLYTNYIAKWCMEFKVDTLDNIKASDIETYLKIEAKTTLTEKEIEMIK